MIEIRGLRCQPGDLQGASTPSRDQPTSQRCCRNAVANGSPLVLTVTAWTWSNRTAVSVRDGSIVRLVDVSASQGHIVPTSLARFESGFLLGNLGQFAPDDPVAVGVRHIQVATPVVAWLHVAPPSSGPSNIVP